MRTRDCLCDGRCDDRSGARCGQAPDGSLAEKVIYPVGVTANSAHPEEAKLFTDFLASDEALAVFEEYGFSPNV